MILTSRERVRLAMDHKEADMIPIDFGGMRSTGISAIAYNKLKDYLSMHKYPTKMYDIFQQLAEPDLDILNFMHGDVVQVHRYEPAFGININKWKQSILQDGSHCLVPFDYNPIKNSKGGFDIINNNQTIARMPKGGLYFDVITHPYENVQTLDDIDKIPLPKLSDTEIFFLINEAKNLYENTSYSILGSFGGNVVEDGQLDWGYEKFFMQLALEPDLMHYYFNRKVENHLKNLKKYMAAVGKYVDIVQFGDDLGTQENSQISINMYKEMIKPYHKKQYSFVRNNYPNVKVFLHSCGSIYDLIPELIDAGVQILNPVQISARRMNPLTLKNEFGKELTFWGAGASTQTTVSFGTINEIKKEVEELIKIFAPGGGFIFSQIHNIQADISPEKIIAIYDTANRFRKYPILY
ncbi:hypothetical protein G9F72_006455 [Clostridium estertheticum]|uniref:uroporphyrinogen decarboxylase family protein n=1 Tax=Clostridium estertheticum TaxID=238834 RepID=UPI001921A0A1|nr:uroporphyrinogen decarboxylase family protein [Clostridium estertheticum]MBZ9685975.1 hypothetical protein [Clostridium estertheticum]